MEDVCTPSINSELMTRFVGKRVRLLGEVESVGDGSMLQVRAADKGLINVQLDRSQAPQAKIAEFIGLVVDPHTLKAESNTSWGDGVDLDNHNASIKLMNGPFHSLFNA